MNANISGGGGKGVASSSKKPVVQDTNDLLMVGNKLPPQYIAVVFLLHSIISLFATGHFKLKNQSL